MEKVLHRQGNRATQVVAWVTDKMLIIAALCVLMAALAFSAFEVVMGWIAKKLFDLTERIK